MQALEFVAVRRKRIEKAFLVEALCQVQILGFSRHSIKVGEHFSHPAVLHQKHALHLLFA